MPKPPTLPVIDWRSVFDSGQPFEAWIAHGESAENRQRMQAEAEGQHIDPHQRRMLEGLGRAVHVLAIAEDWCGDVVRHVPVLRAMESAAKELKVRYITREQNPELFARYLTNGGEAIPKFVFLSDAFVECGNWGPMPHGCRRLISRGKACGDVRTARQRVAELYAADPHRGEVLGELLELVDIAAASQP